MAQGLSRRELIINSGVSGMVILTGCLSSGGGDRSATRTATNASVSPASGTPTPSRFTGTYADTAAGPEPYPDRPQTMTPESVKAYAEQFEYARTYNSLYEPDVETMDIGCRAVHEAAGSGGQYALATCQGASRYANDVYAEWGQIPAIYFVRPELTIRVEEVDQHRFDCQDVFAADTPTENFTEPCDGPGASYRAYNLGSTAHTLRVVVEFITETGREEVLERSYEMPIAAGIEQESVTYRRGTYRVTAALENGREATYQWSLESEPTFRDPPVAVLVTPNNGVAIRRPPFPELIW